MKADQTYLRLNMSSPLIVKSVVEIGCCKVCQGEATLYGVTDFNTICHSENASRYTYPLTGVAIYYHQCQTCGLVYTHACDDWTSADYAQHMYNEDYGQFDPNYEINRPMRNRDLILTLFKKYHGKKMLDYGGGTGTLARLMQEVGIDMVAWDPFVPGDYPELNSYEFMTSFEVFEHTPEPHKTLAEVSGFLKKGGVFFFSTATTDEVSHLGMTDWYIAPRTGHITIHSEASLNALFSAHGFQITHLNRWSHVAMKMVA